MEQEFVTQQFKSLKGVFAFIEATDCFDERFDSLTALIKLVRWFWSHETTEHECVDGSTGDACVEIWATLHRRLRRRCLHRVAVGAAASASAST